jgi:hypothetical protein
MNKHERFANREWEWLFLDGYRPSEYAFEVSILAHAKEKHLVIYRQKLAEAREKYTVEEPDLVEQITDENRHEEVQVAPIEVE